MDTITVAEARKPEAVGHKVTLHGWVRTRRDSKGGFSFLEINDGSCLGNVQVIADGSLPNYASEILKLCLGKLPRNDQGALDFGRDFFGRAPYLTVSGQLEAEVLACALGKVYPFGPTFRAENSNTSRHLAEFWMVEPEMAFFDLNDNMRLAERFLKRIFGDVLVRCREDMQFFEAQIEKTAISTLENILQSDFVQLPYT